ncbi:MAG: glycosyltransferase family 1 protein, partial [Anaerolinea sp.]|nr:glycosyltransferase family 1 protein [Anaerolinea sp.]
ELGLPARRVHVTPLAGRPFMRPASPASVKETTVRLGLARPYILCVGTWNRNKRIVDALRATAMLKQRGIDIDLALAGLPAPHVAPHYAREVARLGIAGRVHFLGRVADADLPALYTGARALVFASEYEGFGLPPLEAMACGTPAIVSAIPVLQEHSAGAAITVPTRSPGAIAASVEELLRSPTCRDEWIGRGLERAAKYSWDRTAAATMEVYRGIA